MNKTFLYNIIGATEDILSSYKNHTMTVKEIAVKYKVTDRQIYNIVKKHNLTRGISKIKNNTNKNTQS